MHNQHQSYSPHGTAPRKTKRVKYVLLGLGVVIAIAGLFFGSRILNTAKQESTTVSDTVKKMTRAASKPSKQPGPAKDAALEQKLAAWVDAHAGDYGISVREINGEHRTAAWQPDKVFVAASTYKVYLVYAIMHEIETGNRYTMSSRISNGQTVSTCMNDMLVYSNNSCAESLGMLIGWSQIDNFLHANGFSKTSINNYGPRTNLDKKTTAADMTTLMTRLATSKLVSKEHAAFITNDLKKQIYRERIPAGVPRTVVVADKPGFLPGIENDTAIVYGPKSTYVISLFSTGSTPAKLADVSRLVYEYLEQ